MAATVPTFEMVDASTVPAKTAKAVSAEQKKVNDAFDAMLKGLQPGKSARLPLAAPTEDAKYPSRSLGIQIGHSAKRLGMTEKITTSNDGKFFYVTLKSSSENGSSVKA